MTITDMLGQSLTLTLLGMGVVFTFLVILIVFMVLTEKFVKALKLDKEPVENTFAASMGAVPAAQNNTAVIAAIAAAVREKQD
jgi:oxaloacetate decarboxylase gamma subunit